MLAVPVTAIQVGNIRCAHTKMTTRSETSVDLQ